MTCAGHKSAGFVGIRVLFCKFERAERTVGYIDAVRVGIELCAGAGVLQIILPTVLVHPGAFDIGPVGEHAADQGLHIVRDHAFRNALALYEGLIAGFNVSFGGRKFTVVVAVALISDLLGMAFDERDLFAGRVHRFGVQLHAPDRSLV